MKNRQRNPRSFPLAYSGRIIGAVVDALDLDEGVLTRRTARRFFQGRSINEHNRSEIFKALGEALVDRGIVPETDTFRKHGIPMADFLTDAIAHAAHRWDGLLSLVQNRSATVEGRSIVSERLLRFVVIDLSLRIFALLRLSGLDPNPPEVPTWAQGNGGGRLLRELTARAGLTRIQLAARLNVSPSTVDNWLDGKVRPGNDGVWALAGTLSGSTNDLTAVQLEQQIQLQFTLAAVADLLDPWIGREQTVELCTALVRFVWMITEDVREMGQLPVNEVPDAEIDAFRLGSEHPATHNLLNNLAILVTDGEWRRDLLATTLDWSLLFQDAAAEANPKRSAAGLAQDVTDVPAAKRAHTTLSEPHSADDPALEAVSQLADEAVQIRDQLASGNLPSLLGVFDAGIVRRQSIVREFPLSALAHYQLGSFLGMVGKNLGRRDLADEGVTECKIAVGLLPGWDAPAVETGIILGNIGAYDEAFDELVKARETLPEETPHFSFNMGYVQMRLHRYREALNDFDRVLEASPDYALASLYASHSAFMFGDKRTGQRHAKRARILGEPGAFNAWRRGAYDSVKSRR